MTSTIIAINKPVGPSSHDIVNQVRRISGERKVGHAGTLDPLASGVLVLGIGREGTKQLGKLMLTTKEYVTVIRLGVTSSTDDLEGEKTNRPEFKIPTVEEVKAAVRLFVGQIQQVPPVYSAIKIHGQPAYKRARAGQKLNLGPRTVTINGIAVIDYTWPDLKLKVSCESGVYIRSLARDIGEKLHTGGYMASLVRTRSGEFTLDKALTLPELGMDKAS